MQKIAIALAAMVLIAGCVGSSKTTTTTEPPATSPPTTSPPTTTTGPVKTFDMLITHTSYGTPVINVKKGDHVVIRARAIDGTATHKHGITVDELGVNQAVTTEDRDNPQLVEFDATKVGEFKMYCGTCKDGIYGANHPKLNGQVVVTE
ncbi:MAG TPA: hypothetical protein VI933_02090 [archaeon]|nr:hypothetical protein [archaeon]